jgi:DNA-binding MarR family transcriptional regulator
MFVLKEFDPQDPDYNQWLFFAQVRTAMLRARNREVYRYGIGARQASVLFVVNALGARATPAEISRWLFREPHSVSSILDRMEKQGLLRRHRDLGKKTPVKVVLTEKGKETHRNCTKRESMHYIMGALTEEERQQLIKCLTKLRDATSKYLGETYELPFP